MSIGLSIVVPVYNEAPWLRRCLDSITCDERVEVVVVDDGSTDGSGDIVRGYDGFWHLAQPHLGVSRARNYGLDFATGEYVTFLDSDDEYLPGAAEAMLSHMRDDLVVQYNHMIHRKAGDVPRMTHVPGAYTPENRPRTWYGVWNKTFHRDVVEGIRFDESLQCGEDAIFALRCIMEAGSVTCVPDATVLRHVDNPSSLTKVVDAGMLGRYGEAFRALAESDPGNRDIVMSAMGELIPR